MTGGLEISKAFAQDVPEISEDEKKKEFLALLGIFERFIDSLDGSENADEILEELMELRADFAIHHAVKGFGMNWEDALRIIRTQDLDLTDEERARKEILLAAVDNLVDFAVAEEYQLSVAVEEESESGEDSEEEQRDMMIAFCEKYNGTYAHVENLDIKYAMAVAGTLMLTPSDSTLMYVTQGDERVRPWHLQYEGFTAPKREFPAWLIPPIEHQCRCYLIEVDEGRNGIPGVSAKAEPTIPEWFNMTFKESVALGGRIFSDEHPYFQIREDALVKLKQISSRIKDKYLQNA